jgi:phosphonate transport system substrate-binding protein
MPFKQAVFESKNKVAFPKKKSMTFSPGKYNRLFFYALCTVILVLTYGCFSDSEVKVIDFNKTVITEQPGKRSEDYQFFRVAVAAMISPKETFIYYHQLLDYIGDKLGREIQLIQRKTYGEINELLGKGYIDLAFICSGPYVVGKEKYGFDLLATPQVQKSHFYQSYLIVNKTSQFKQLEDLRGRIFAFTDPDSNTGKLVPTYWLTQMGEQPETFFGKTIFTYSHDNSILAVAKALVDGAAVDGLIWDYYNIKNPVFTTNTRIIRKSEPYGIPPIVASRYLAPEIKARIRQLLFSMHRDPEGQKILKELMIDQFITPKDEWYESIRRMERKEFLPEKKTHASKKS